MFQVQKHFFHDQLGLGFDVRADYENEFNDFGSWVDFMLKKNYREKFYYIFANPNFEPYHIDVQFSQADHDATKEVREINRIVLRATKYHFTVINLLNSHITCS